MRQIYTIGHSTRTAEQFIGLLQAHGIHTLVDIRSIPKSRHNPQFAQTALKKTLGKAGIEYVYLGALGGLRHAKEDSVNRGWHNASFRGYADYMATEKFHDGLDELIGIAKNERTAIMCAEAVPWRCHRSLVADALTKKQWMVRHIQSRKTASEHVLTPFLRMRAGKIIYPEQAA